MLNFDGYAPAVLDGALLTIEVALASLVMATLLGILGALGKLSRKPLPRRLAAGYTTLIRSIPDLVLMLLIYFGGQAVVNQAAYAVGYEDYIEISPFVAGVGTIGFIFGAYLAETFRGAILAVPPGQLEAGYAYGMSAFQVFRRILFPQMMRHALPGFGNNWLVLLKTTALVSVIGLDDMVRKASLAAGATQKPFTFYLLVAGVFLAFTTLSTLLLQWAERRYSPELKRSL
ncbi:ABC transporter permease [Marinobacterium arenosum]|uniref:ABC transporter permease n=1 Tax=Marinobacterium arenosum TaxID=2862496 RepID=UPI001C96C141|nr:ABC transporter permease [Marinobacterium arenosum]MBY4675356.1 ABC transporter permease [Marinobacterium arenosum]